MPKNDRIKFRFWSKTHAKYVYCASLNDLLVSDRIPVWENGNLLTMEKPDDIIPEQCTGLTDKNGRLIFEGDIVTDSERVGYITWFDESGAWGVTGFLFGRNPDRLEIIGNIHENRKKNNDET